MDLVVYQLECQNTKSNKFFGDRVTKSYFENALFEAIEALTRLDAIKKSLFYGKDSLSYDVNGNHRNIDCNSLQIHALHNEPQAGLDILHGIIGKATESGELLEALMNAVIGGQKLDPVNLVEEIGDGFWYDGIILHPINSSFYKVARINNAKLKKRFPDKFNESAAINRDLAAERRELEDKLEFTDPPSEPIPEPEETDGTMLQRIGTDGHLWAEAFVQRVQICNTANMDECAKLDLIDTMRAWFANAIEAGKSAGVQKERDDYERRANAGRYSGGESEHSEIIREITRS